MKLPELHGLASSLGVTSTHLVRYHFTRTFGSECSDRCRFAPRCEGLCNSLHP